MLPTDILEITSHTERHLLGSTYWKVKLTKHRKKEGEREREGRVGRERRRGRREREESERGRGEGGVGKMHYSMSPKGDRKISSSKD